MANSEKDRYGDTLRKKEKAQEEEYFSRRERELIEKLRGERGAGGQGSEAATGGSPAADSASSPMPERLGESGRRTSRRGFKAWLERLLGLSPSDG